jgi:hypothetical protein
MTRAVKKKGGRPKKPPAERKRDTLHFRATGAMHVRLTMDAIANGRSLSEEIESRVAASIASEGRLIETLAFAFGERVAGLMLIIGHALRDGGTLTQTLRPMDFRKMDFSEDNWLKEPWAFDQLARCVALILEAARPEGDPTPSEWLIRFMTRAFGEGTANTWSEQLAEGAVSRALDVPIDARAGALHEQETGRVTTAPRWAIDVQRLLGPLAEHMRRRLKKGGGKEMGDDTSAR